MDYIPRICSGMIGLKYDNKTYYYSFPSNKTLYKAQLKEQEIIQSNTTGMNSEQVFEMLISMGKWSEEKEKEVTETIPKIIEELKIELYLTYVKNPDKGEILKVKSKIDKMKNYLFSLLVEKHQFDEYNIETIAKKAKALYILKKCVSNLDVKPECLLNAYYSSILDENQIRVAARSDSWQIKWIAIKKGCKVFDGQLTDEQERLIRWSIVYDNLAEMENPPPESVIEDDDALDGYFVHRKMEIHDKEILAKIESKYERKGMKYNELFLPAKDMEEAKRIDSLNSEWARQIKKNRFKTVNEKGVVVEADMPDQRFKLDMVKNQLGMRGQTHG